jgi:hypothetical protein
MGAIIKKKIMYVFSSSEYIYIYWFCSIKRMMDGSRAKLKNDIN